MAGFRIESPGLSTTTVKQAVSGALAGAAATYLDGVAKELGQYSSSNVSTAKATVNKAVKKSGVLGELGLTQTSTLVTVAVVLVILMMILK